ncbi:DUF6049 family protein [Microbacterium excoecariae]|uniref:DUF6049 family protein n=1 Tax=Microbacterium excoecariae TaxID=2715210 RepID=UPI00140DE972|nr:DUF6049 family protein [Microbacterium excoecariae]NHI15866.1 hypothetical protein [Microbacterium excoecariae]
MNDSTSWTRRPLTLGAALVVGCGLAVAAPGAATAATLPTSVASADEAPPEAADLPPVTLRVGDQGVVSGDEAALDIGLANPDDAAYDAAEIVIRRGDALTDAAAVEAWVSGAGGDASEEIATIETNDLGAGEATNLSESVDVSDLETGVYPVLATYSGPEIPAGARAVMIVSGGSAQPVALVVPITGPVATTGVYSADVLATLTGESGLLTAELDAVEGTSAILAVDPAIPAAIRALGDDAPPQASAWLARLMALPNDRFALQFADADVATQVAAGLDAPLGVDDLSAYTAGLGEDATGVDALTDIGETASAPVYWPASGSLNDELAAAITAGDGARVLVPASDTADGEPALGERTIAYDDALSDRLLAAAALADPAERDRALSAATAEIWLAADDEPVVLALDRMGSDTLTTDQAGSVVVDAEADVTADGLDAAVDAALGTPASTPRTLSALAGSGSIPLAEYEVDEARIAAVAGYLADVPGLQHIATALEDPSLLTSQTRAEFLRLLAVSWSTNPDGWEDAAETLDALNTDRQQAIDIQQPSPVQLLSPEAPMPVWIRNDLPYPANVVVVAEPDDPRLSIEERTVVVAQPDSTTRVTIPIEARVGSGDVTVHYRLEAVTGEVIGPERDMPVTVRADWERIGITAFGVLIAGLLGIGVVRQVRRRRRLRSEAADNHSDSGIQEAGE